MTDGRIVVSAVTLGVLVATAFWVRRRARAAGSWSEFEPWGAPGPGLRLPDGWLRRVRAHGVYLVATLVAFGVFLVAFGADPARVPQGLLTVFVYEIPELVNAPYLVPLHVLTSFWINWHPVQLGYVAVLLGLVGVRVEAHEGTRRTVLMFVATSAIGAIGAGLVLLGLDAVMDAAWVDQAMAHRWTGGSAGAFGLLGLFAARARRPLPWVVLVLSWEVNVALWYLKDYTSAFHVIAFFTALAWARTHPRPAPPT